MYCIVEYVENHAGLLGLVSSICMLVVTSIYAIITWWHASYTKQTLIESIKQNKVEKQPYVVPKIDSVLCQKSVCLSKFLVINVVIMMFVIKLLMIYVLCQYLKQPIL